MSKRAAVKKATQGGYLTACRMGKRHVTPRKQNLYVPSNGVKTKAHTWRDYSLALAAAEEAGATGDPQVQKWLMSIR